MKLFMVMSLSPKVYVGEGSKKMLVNLVWADGMIGACPVFDDEQLARRYASEEGGAVIQIEHVKAK